jgi:hypothetical protein
LLKMVAKSRDNRFADTAALRAGIEEARHDRGKKSGFPQSLLGNYKLMGALGAAAVILVGVLFLLLHR